jgi:hypothetical protein
VRHGAIEHATIELQPAGLKVWIVGERRLRRLGHSQPLYTRRHTVYDIRVDPWRLSGERCVDPAQEYRNGTDRCK